jgi:3-oxoacyl-[acyl-carrier protein] reductase
LPAGIFFVESRGPIEQRVAIVTGASRGIGRAIAERLAGEGRLVVLVSRSADQLEQVRAAIEAAGGSAEVRTCDVGDGEALGGLVEEVASTHGRLDILVNNAGITRDGLILRMTDDDFDQVITVNLRSVFVACRAAARPMMRNRFGRIISIGSVTGLMGNPGQVNYAAAKSAMTGLTKSIAKELGSKGITANVVAPGFVTTDMIEDVPEAMREEVIRRLPVRRFGEPSEIAHAVSYLASDQAGYVTGQVLVVDGGLLC